MIVLRTSLLGLFLETGSGVYFQGFIVSWWSGHSIYTLYDTNRSHDYRTDIEGNLQRHVIDVINTTPFPSKGSKWTESKF